VIYATYKNSPCQTQPFSLTLSLRVSGAQTTTMTLIAIDNVHKSFGSVRAVQGISVALDKGEVLGFSNHKKIQKTATFETKSAIVNGDVIDVLKQLSTKEKFDVIIADPPYNIGKDFGNNIDYMQLDKYIAWSREWLDLCFKVLADGGLIYIYGFPEILARVAVHYPLENQRILAWHYTNKTTPSSSFWQRSYESILCLWTGKRPSLEIDQIREPYTENYLKCSGKKRKNTKGRFGDTTTEYQVHEQGALPRDVIKIPALAGGAGRVERHFLCRTCSHTLYNAAELKNHQGHDILQHPTQKPMQLTKRLMLSKISKGNGKVLIPFAGSGSECVVAKTLGVEFFGIELNPEYVEYAHQWLALID
jgi:site-specific DNA-methyltransferase (adenine-specific)